MTRSFPRSYEQDSTCVAPQGGKFVFLTGGRDRQSDRSQVGAAVAIHSEQDRRGWRDRRNEFVQPMRADAIHLAQHLIGDGTGFVLKKYAV